MVGSDFLLPLDESGFSLRLCPRCASEFKVRGTSRDAPALANALADHLPQTDRDEVLPGEVLRYCPYCGTADRAEAWWTCDQQGWIEAQARRLAEEIRWRLMRLPFERLGDNPNPTYISVPPISGPSPSPDERRNHLLAVPLPCCGEELLVMDRWVAPVHCHYCGYVHERQTVRDIGLELAQLRAWHSRIGFPFLAGC